MTTRHDTRRRNILTDVLDHRCYVDKMDGEKAKKKDIKKEK